MRRDSCRGLEGQLSQYDQPVWEPLVGLLGERLAEGFMWMHEEELEDESALHAYKHVFTRRYLYLAEDGRAFERAPCGRFVPLRLDYAIERALCIWWILSGWEAQDADAIGEAIVRAQRSASGGS
jgi:hypothetical protein